MVAYQIKKQSVSFQYALKGLGYAFSTQPHFKFHLLAAFFVALAGLYFGLSTVEWLVIVLSISQVLITELINTALEETTDALKVHKKTEQDDYYIMVAKDVAAGAVLVSAVFSVIVGLIIFAPRILPLFLAHKI